MKLKREKREKRRAIALAAIDLLSQNGLAKTSVESIAKAANVGKGTVYLYFESKEEIVLEIWDYVTELMDEYHKEIFTECTKSEEKLNHYFDFSIFDEEELTDKLLKLFAMNLSIILNSSHEGIVKRFQDWTNKEVMEVHDIIAKGMLTKEFKEVDARVMAKLFVNDFQGTLVNAIVFGKNSKQIRTFMKAQKAILIDALKS